MKLNEDQKDQIKRNVNANFKAVNDLQVRPGDVIRVAPRVFVLVITKDRHSDKSFYYCQCTKAGVPVRKYQNISAANYISNSVMLSLRDTAKTLKVVGHRELEKRTVFQNCKKYVWYETGDKSIDLYMAQLDARYSLFSDNATDVEVRKFARDEDRNYHSENGSFVAEYAFMTWLRKNRDARLLQFRMKRGA